MTGKAGRRGLKPLTLLFLLAMTLVMETGAYIDAVASTLSVQQLGWASDEYSGFTSVVAWSGLSCVSFWGRPLSKHSGCETR